MRILLLALLFAVLVGHVDCQTWFAGDNSTVTGCSTKCSVRDADLACWNKTLQFFEKVLIGQLRHYIAVQVDVDQWHRRHGKPDGQDFDKVETAAIAHMQSLLLEKDDVLTKDVVGNVTSMLIGSVKKFSDHTMSFVPHFLCPLPCEYKHDTYRNLFIGSIILNVVLAVTVIPFMRKMMLRNEPHDALLGRG